MRRYLADEAPPCTTKSGHRWGRPHHVVGGLKENPGVWGHGGGVVIHDVCLRRGCTVRRKTDTWATDSTTGMQGRSVRYSE